MRFRKAQYGARPGPEAWDSYSGLCRTGFSWYHGSVEISDASAHTLRIIVTVGAYTLTLCHYHVIRSTESCMQASYTDCQRSCPTESLLGGNRSSSLWPTQGRPIFVQGTSCHLPEAQTIRSELLATPIAVNRGVRVVLFMTRPFCVRPLNPIQASRANSNSGSCRNSPVSSMSIRIRAVYRSAARRQPEVVRSTNVGDGGGV